LRQLFAGSATGTEAELPDDTAAASIGTDTACNCTAAAAIKPSSTFDDALVALCSSLNASAQRASESQQHLCSQLRQEQGCVETIWACNSTGFKQQKH